ncbi:FkbM family methyltransferase [Flavobacterium aurantiibacter]|uniref:Methyltransferase FkbM domain-containing protein n=1 Tax=Flavobacterium aurantiibacter TaxID=2023067 RepID=A0A255ZS46_9FLAO|nr:FkbM family methyltransferase [Flavobacterium aurantiibacter]OYQ44256.1 hypothetical protein CHX27_08085 [Flavobacterium aurantiibacter]
MTYHSQFEQDRFLDEVVFAKQKGGFFVDVGAHDGLTYSNSAFFEFYRSWDGICVEPNPQVFDKLKTARQVRCENCGLGAVEGVLRFTSISGYAEMLSGFTDFYAAEHKQRIARELEKRGGSVIELEIAVKPLSSLVDSHKTVDFMSIDTEGNELEVLKGIAFEKQHIRVLVIENNYQDNRVLEFLKELNYLKVFTLDTDNVYVLQSEWNAAMKYRLFKWKLRKKKGSILRRLFG